MEQVNTFITAAEKYLSEEFSVLPTDQAKRPTVDEWTPFRTCRMYPEQVGRYFNQPNVCGIGILGGKISGNLEVLDIDTKNDDSGTLWEDYKSLIQNASPGLLEKLVIARTRNNGYHLYYRCPQIEGNKKLAKKKDQEVLIETRGEGGYVIAEPSPGYKFIQGSTAAVPEITPDERQSLFTVAKCFHQLFEPVRTPKKEVRSPTGTSPELADYGLSTFEDYNQKADVPALLEKHGWKIVAQKGPRIFLLRPGDTDSKTSGNYHIEKKIFYCFSSSTAFETDKGYNPVQVYAVLECGNDLSLASRQLYAEGYGERRTAQPTEAQPTNGVSSLAGVTVPFSTFDDFEKYRITKEKYIPDTPAIITIGVAKVAAACNITPVTAESKAGKTAITGVFMAGAISETGEIDGFTHVNITPNPDKKAVIHFDTEQSEPDQQYNLKTILKRAGYSTTPNHYLSYNIRTLQLNQYQKFTDGVCRIANDMFNGIHMIIVDGGADYIPSVNDEEQANGVILFLTQLAVNYKCPVILVIHLNENAGKNGDTMPRGHLGRQAVRKGYAQLNITKEADVSVMQTLRARKAGSADTPLVCFKYSHDKGYHVSVDAEAIKEAKADKRSDLKILKWKGLAEKIFAPPVALSYSEAANKLAKATGTEYENGRKKIKDLLAHELIILGADGNYRLRVK